MKGIFIDLKTAKTLHQANKIIEWRKNENKRS